MTPEKPIPVVILGATGMVGQRLVAGLHRHPWFTTAALCASDRSAGRPYREACAWHLPGSVPAAVAELPVRPCDPAALAGPPGLVLSALPSGVARETERRFAEAGWMVVSNAGAWRADPRVPLVIPEVNPDHLGLLDLQPWAGGILTNPNCTSTPITLALKPLHDAFGVQAVFAASYQAVSGAGYPGESAWDMVGNVRPHPGDEEAKVAVEPAKMLGGIGPEGARPADLALSARCVRVPVADGHLVALSVRTRVPASPEAAREVLAAWPGACPEALPSSPRPLLRLRPERDRPSPRMDADAGGGMAVSIGRVEACPVLGLKLFALAHNTLRGAAGAAILNAELLVARGRV